MAPPSEGDPGPGPGSKLCAVPGPEAVEGKLLHELFWEQVKRGERGSASAHGADGFAPAAAWRRLAPPTTGADAHRRRRAPARS